MKELIKITPLFNRIVTTMDVYQEDQYNNSLLDITKTKGSLKEYQTVLSVGTTVRDIKVGDVVYIDLTRYMVVQHQDKSLKGNMMGDELKVKYNFNVIKLNGKDCLMLFDQDVVFIVNESKEVEDKTGPVIIQPEKPKIIV